MTGDSENFERGSRSDPLYQLLGSSPYYGRVNIHDIRLANLCVLLNEAGSIEALADLAEVSDDNLKAIYGGKTYPNGRRKGIGDRLARKLEAGMAKPDGWMDILHGQPAKKNDDAIHLSADEQILLVLYRRASPEIRKLIMYAARLAK